jgi:hypothetical protein
MFGWSVNVTGAAPQRIDPVCAVQTQLGSVTHGLTAGTKIASNLGWCAVDALSVGDDVLTFDNGMQRIVDIRRTVLWADMGGQVPPQHWPVIVPEGALGNRCDLVLLPDQGVLVESDEVCDTHGDPFALVPAQALEGLRGITRAKPKGGIELITLYFGNDEVIYTEGGFLVHCSALQAHAEQTAQQDEQPYQMLPLAEAQRLASSLNVDAHVAASRASYVIGATHRVLIA